MIGWVIAVPVGVVLGVTSWWHIGGAGTGGRPFVILLALAVVWIFTVGLE